MPAIGNDGRVIVFYLLMLIPLEVVMTSTRIVKDGSRCKAVAVAGSLLVLMSCVKLGYEMASKERSYYDMVEVLPSASTAEIKKGYKKAALRLHPDKLQSSGDEDDGDEAFLALKAAYDVLMDSKLRDLYNKFGPQGLEHKNDTTALMGTLGFFYVAWLAVAYLLTRRKSVAQAQTWTFTGLLALSIFEYQACILSFDFLQDVLPHLAMFEKIEFLHRLYPPYLLGARMVAWMLYEDVETYNAIVLQRLHAKTDMLLGMIRQLHIEMGRAPTQTAASAAAPQATDVDAITRVDPWGANLAHMQEQFRPLHPAMVGQTAEASARGQRPIAQPVKGGRGLGSLVWFFGVYFFFQWLLGRGS